MLLHKYLLFIEGLPIRSRVFDTRLDAEIFMHRICKQKNLIIESTEVDKHEYKYSNHQGIRFYINRI